MSVSKIDLLNKRFTKRMFGYSRLEVDQFLLEVAEAMGAMADNQKELRKKVKRLESAVSEYRKRDETLRDTLMSTQKMVDDLKVQASREAQIIMDEARSKAESTVQKGHHRLAQIHEEIEALKRQRSQFEIQLKSLLDSHLKMLDYNDPEMEKIEELESKLTYLKKAEGTGKTTHQIINLHAKAAAAAGCLTSGYNPGPGKVLWPGSIKGASRFASVRLP